MYRVFGIAALCVTCVVCTVLFPSSGSGIVRDQVRRESLSLFGGVDQTTWGAIPAQQAQVRLCFLKIVRPSIPMNEPDSCSE